MAAILESCVDEQSEAAHDLSAALAKPALVVFITKNTPYFVVLPEQQPYNLTIAGSTSVVPVVLTDATARRDTPADFRLMSSRVEDPVQAQIPAFVKEIAGVVIKQYGAVAKHNPRMWAYAADEVELPFSRASIVESGTVTLGCDAGSTEASYPRLAPCPRGKNSIDVEIAATYANTPKTRIDFAAVAGGVLGPYRGHLKMKVDGGRYASDPAMHGVTMAAIAIHLKRYDATLPRIGAAERWSLLAGAVLTPAAGVGSGVSFTCLRGFAINAGEVILWVPTGSSPGALAPAGSNQLPHRYSFGTFVGASYRLGS